MTIATGSNYYIKPIEYSTSNTNKYFNVEGLQGSIEAQENKWYFDLNFYLVMNANLPIDLFNTNIYNELFEINNITLNKAPNNDLPDWIIDTTEVSTYHTNFHIDMTNSKINEKKLEDYFIDLNFSYDINYDVLNQNPINSSNQAIDDFINECHNLKTNTSIKYTNYQVCNNDHLPIEFIEKYWLDSHNGYVIESKNLSFNFNDYHDCLEPITNLVRIHEYHGLKVEGYDLNFNYWDSKNNENKSLEVHQDLNETLWESKNIIFDQQTYFDTNSYQISLSNNLEGVKGFYLPFEKASGNYQLAIKLKSNTSYLNVLFKNEFTFNQQEIFNYKTSINSYFINDLSNYQKIVW